MKINEQYVPRNLNYYASVPVSGSFTLAAGDSAGFMKSTLQYLVFRAMWFCGGFVV